MTQDKIIELARQAGFDIGMWEKLSDDDDVFGYGIDGTHENLEAFARLVAEKERERMTVVATDAAGKAIDVALKLEREACAKVCEDSVEYAGDTLAQAIRARGKA